MTTDDIRDWLDDMDAELSGCDEDLGIIAGELDDMADSLENFIEAKTDQYNSYYSDCIRKQVRAIESVRKRIFKEG